MTRVIERFAVILPIVVLAALLAQTEWQHARSQTWLFAIQGYDPRDLLRGHYIRFQLAVTPDETLESCSIDDPDCCYCLAPGQDRAAHTTLASCGLAERRCEDFVRTAPLHALRRFYIPETGRVELERRLQTAAREGRAHLAVAVGPSGDPLIDGLLVDGIPIEVAGEPEASTTSPR